MFGDSYGDEGGDVYAYSDGTTISMGPKPLPTVEERSAWYDENGNWRLFNADKTPEPADDPPVTLFGWALPGWLAGGIILGTAGVLCVAAWWAVAEVCAAVIRWLP